MWRFASGHEMFVCLSVDKEMDGHTRGTYQSTGICLRSKRASVWRVTARCLALGPRLADLGTSNVCIVFSLESFNGTLNEYLRGV